MKADKHQSHAFSTTVPDTGSISYSFQSVTEEAGHREQERQESSLRSSHRHSGPRNISTDVRALNNTAREGEISHKHIKAVILLNSMNKSRPESYIHNRAQDFVFCYECASQVAYFFK